MKTIHNKILIFLAISILFIGGYVYFSNNINVNAATDTTGPLTSSTTGKASNPLSGKDITDTKIAEDTAFLYTLTSLTKIKIDTSLFSDASFNALNDNTVTLEPMPTGRPNPFAPIAGFVPQGTQVKAVLTNSPDQITGKSAVLNGATSNPQIVASSVYFEYGPTPTLGKVTPNGKQSLIGTWSASITGLKSSTAYFFRAVAKINGALEYGEVISFTTN